MTARVLPRGHPGPSQAASTCDPSPFSEDEVEKLIRDLHFGAEAKARRRLLGPAWQSSPDAGRAQQILLTRSETCVCVPIQEAQKDEPGAHQMWLHLLVALTGEARPLQQTAAAAPYTRQSRGRAYCLQAAKRGLTNGRRAARTPRPSGTCQRRPPL